MSETIQASVARLTGPRELHFDVEPLPTIVSDGHIRAETIVTAISVGTELAAYQGLPPLRPGPIYPRVVGYCNVARVVEVGAQVESVAPGDRILTTQSHRSAFVCAESDLLATLPDGIDDGAAATTYLFHLGHVALRNAGVRAGDRVAVVGLGALGMGTVACGSLAGARVCGFSDQDDADQMVTDFGGDRRFRKSDAATVADHRDHTASPGADIVVLTTDRWEDYLLALQLARPRGIVSVLGFPGRGRAPATFNPLDSQYFYDKQLRIQSSNWSAEPDTSPARQREVRRTNCSFLVASIAAGRLPGRQMLSGTSSWHELGHVYDELGERRPGVLSHELTWTS